MNCCPPAVGIEMQNRSDRHQDVCAYRKVEYAEINWAEHSL